MKIEEWKTIDEYPNYQISSRGNVRSNRTGKDIKEFYNPEGYCLFKLYKDAIPKTVKAHRLVAKYFISNPLNKAQVNHIDGVKSNNNFENLEWVTKSENQIHAYENGLQFKGHDRDLCLQISLDGFLIGVFKSKLNASEQTGIGRKRIEKAIKRQKSYGGYLWA